MDLVPKKCLSLHSSYLKLKLLPMTYQFIIALKHAHNT